MLINTLKIHEGKALRDYIKDHKLNQEKVATALGITRQGLNYHFNKEKLDFEFKEKLPEIGISIFNVKNNFTLQEPHLGYGKNPGTPVYDLEATAGNIEISEHIPETIKGYINIPSFKGCIAFLYVRGDSMYPRLKAGDLIGVIPVADLDIIQYGQVYLIITKDNQRMVKYIRKGKEENMLILRSENNKYDDIDIDRKKILKLFMVKGPVRDDWQ